MIKNIVVLPSTSECILVSHHPKANTMVEYHFRQYSLWLGLIGQKSFKSETKITNALYNFFPTPSFDYYYIIVV